MRSGAVLRAAMLGVLGLVAVIAVTVDGIAAAQTPAPGIPPGDPPPVAQGPMPAPHVLPFAAAPQGRAQGPARTPEIVSEGPALGGCDPAYGNGEGVCVPAVFPAGTTDKCGWLKDHGFGALEVPGPDPQRLVPGNGLRGVSGLPLACPVQLGAVPAPR